MLRRIGNSVFPRPNIGMARRHRRSHLNIAGAYWPDNREMAGITYQETDTAKLGVVIKPNSTLVDLWQMAIAAWPMRRFVGSKMWVRGRLGYIWTSYESLQQEVDALRHLLHFMGVSKGSRVGVISENRYEWIVAHLATLQLGAHHVALPTNVTPEEARTIVKSTGMRVLFVETVASYAAVKDWVGHTGDLQHIICFEDQEGEASYSVAVNIAADAKEKIPVASTVADDTAMIMFTAGTTGPPKGVMLSHRNIVANISSIYSQLGEAMSHEDIFLSLCPWTVAGALPLEIWQIVLKGASVCIPPELVEGFQDLTTVHPSIVCSVALPWQRAYNNMVDQIMSRAVGKHLTRLTIGALTESRIMMKPPSTILKMMSTLTLGIFKRQFGTELRLVIIVGQPLTKDQMELFADLDVFMVNTYGCMEAGGLLATDIDVPTRLRALPGVELRIVNENNEVVVPGDMGEILVEAPHAMQGYFDVHIDNNESKNAITTYGTRTFVRTGDFGTLTGQWLVVQGHKDVLITLEDGKVIDPAEVEITLTKSPFIRQAFVFGDRRPYLIALIVPNSTAISNHLKKLERRDGVPVVSEREKSDCIRAELRRVSVKLPARSHVRRFAFVDEFTHGNGFMTVKHGFARQKIEKHYVHYINTLYDEGPKFYGHAVDDYDDLF